MTGIETMHQLRKGQVPFIDGKKTLNVAAISFTVALGSLGLFFQPFLIVRVLCLFLKKKGRVSHVLFFILHFLHHYLLNWVQYKVFPERRTGLDQFMKTLSQKEKRGYRLSDDRGLI